jgi:hypothetical protein
MTHIRAVATPPRISTIQLAQRQPRYSVTKPPMTGPITAWNQLAYSEKRSIDLTRAVKWAYAPDTESQRPVLVCDNICNGARCIGYHRTSSNGAKESDDDDLSHAGGLGAGYNE